MTAMTFRSKLLYRGLLAAVLCGGAALMVPVDGVPGIATAQAEEEERETRRTPALSEQAFKSLSKAQEFIDGNKEEDIPPDLDAALAELDKFLGGRNRNGYEIASAQNMRAFIFFSREDYRNAIGAYQQVLAQGEDIPLALEIGTLYSLGQLYFVLEDYRAAIDYLDRWFAVSDNPNPTAYIFKAQAYYQLQEFGEVPPLVQQAMDVAVERGADIKENWWLLMRAAYYEMENYPEVIRILEILVRDFPKKDYWVQLSGLYGQEGMQKKQIAAIWVAYIQGYLEQEREILNVAGLLMQEEAPYWAARILRDAVDAEIVEDSAKNLQMLAQAWQLAQEVDRAIPVYQSAAEKSDEGELYYRLSQLYLDKDDCAEAVEAADNAIDKGGLKSEANVYLVKGMCEFNLERYDSALASFRSGSRAARRDEDETARRQLNQWLQYVEREKARVEQLRSAQS